MKKGVPVKPGQIVELKQSVLPPEVIDVFNEMIAEKWNGTYAMIKQKEILPRLVKAIGISEDDIFSRGLLNVEDIFRKAGWKVYYDKPGYCETYEPYFNFSVAK